MGLTATFFIIVAGVLVTGIAIAWVLGQRRSPQSALAWLLLIVTLPYVGVPLFFALGTRKTGARYDRVAFAPDPGGPPVHPVDAALRRMGAPAAEPGHAIRLAASAEEARAALERLIDGAEETLEIVLYRLEPDRFSRAFISRLAAAARRGVRVRLLLDQIGTWNRPRKALKVLEKAGAQIRLFSAWPQLRGTGRVNLRNHRKMLIADSTRVWSGGRNVGRFYLGPDDDPATWQDLSLTLEGPAVRRFCELFAADWGKLGADPAPPCGPRPAAGPATAQLVASGPDIDREPFHDVLVHAIHTARKRLLIATPYFLPTDQLRHALVTQARLGLDIRILVPAHSNQPVADFARGTYLREAEEAGATVLRYGPGMMHAKAIVIDDMAFVGSANFDIRSMLLNFEAMLALYDPPEVTALADWFAGLEARSTTGLKPARLPRRLAEAVFRLGAPIL